jgi:hypothetical protein
MKMNLTHFEAMLLLSIFISAVLGITGRRSHTEQIRYALTSFGWFMLAVFGLGWLMFLGHR